MTDLAAFRQLLKGGRQNDEKSRPTALIVLKLTRFGWFRPTAKAELFT